MKIRINDRVMFKDEVVKRSGHDKRTADMRGVVVGLYSGGMVAQVETNGTYISEDGRSLRGIPVNNLTLAK
jgi:hypothetical protein